MDIKQAAEQTAKEFLAASAIERQGGTETEVNVDEEIETPAPVDMAQERRRTARAMPRWRVHGAHPRLATHLQGLLDRGIVDAYKKTKDDSDFLREQGDTARAEMLEQQYMQDYFYPLVDALIRMDSQEELLASEDALELLDNLVITPGNGAKNGFTAVYVDTLYEPVDGREFSTDAETAEGINRMRLLVANDQIRAAVGLANKLQQRIMRGEGRATTDDYELIQRVALRG